ncbi:MAG: hypothetical protein J6X89_06805 [Bacteroidales bacterium]|nr:hypothetical protein [Bacteroidales bacterium]
MKKILTIMFLAAMCLPALAQNDMESMDDWGRVALAPVILDESNVPAAAANAVTSKLIQVITKNGLGTDAYDPRFILTVNMVEMTRDVTATAPPMVALTLVPTLYIGDVVTGNLYSSCSLDPIKGAGTNEARAYMQAIKAMKADTPAVQRCIEKGKQRIIEWYNSQIDFIINEAKALAASDQYDEAIALLFSVPSVCKKAHEKAMKSVGGIFQEKIDVDGLRLLNMASAAWAADQSWDGAQAAANILGQIHPLSAAAPKAEKLVSQIAKRIREVDKREWNFTIRQFDASVSLESQRITAAREIGKARAKRPIIYNNFNRITWW